MKLSEIVKIVNNYDRAMAGLSYGSSRTHLNFVVGHLKDEDRQTLADTANEMLTSDKSEAMVKLEKFGVEIDTVRPDEYRINQNV